MGVVTEAIIGEAKGLGYDLDIRIILLHLREALGTRPLILIREGIGGGLICRTLLQNDPDILLQHQIKQLIEIMLFNIANRKPLGPHGFRKYRGSTVCRPIIGMPPRLQLVVTNLGVDLPAAVKAAVEQRRYIFVGEAQMAAQPVA